MVTKIHTASWLRRMLLRSQLILALSVTVTLISAYALTPSIAFGSNPQSAHNENKKQTSAEKVGLSVGTTAPNIDTKDIEGNLFNLKDQLRSGPVVLVFYRGGWCPYCNLQLRNLAKSLSPFAEKHSTTFVAISADKPQEGQKTKSNEKLPFVLLSDPKIEVIEKYNLAFRVPESLVKKYKEEYQIDLERASGESHHTIAVPGVFVINQEGKIVYAYANIDYKVRAPEEDIKKGILAASKGS